MFLPHEQVMHNWALILLSIVTCLSTMSMRPPMIALGLTYGALYLIFAELWARFGGVYFQFMILVQRKDLYFSLV